MNVNIPSAKCHNIFVISMLFVTRTVSTFDKNKAKWSVISSMPIMKCYVIFNVLRVQKHMTFIQCMHHITLHIHV